MGILVSHIVVISLTAAVLFGAFGLGARVMRWVNASAGTFSEHVIFASGLGLGIIGYWVFLLASVQLLYPSTVRALLVLLAIIAVRSLLHCVKTISPSCLPVGRMEPIELASGMTLALFVFAALIVTLTPSFGNDALSYHLAVPKLYLKHHGFYFIPGNIFSNYPLLGEMLYLIVLDLGSDIAAKGIHFSAALLILVGMKQIMERHVKEVSFPSLGQVLFFAIPSVFVTSYKAYTDLFLALYAVLAVLAFLNFDRSRQAGWLLVAAFASGLAAASKYHGLFIPFLGTLGALVVCRRHCVPHGRTLYLVCIYLAVSVAVGSPFYLKNWILTGNPFHPFFYTVFGGKGWDSEQARLYDFFLYNLGMGRSFLDYLMLPFHLSFHARMNSPLFDGNIGPGFILILPFALGMRKVPFAIKTVLGYCGFTFLFWALSAQQIRYLIPVFPFLAIVCCYVLAYYRKRRLIFWYLMLSAGATVLYGGYHAAKEFGNIGPFRYVAGLETRDAFLARTVSTYGMFQYINGRLPGDAKVLFVYMRNFGYLCDRDYYSDSIFESYTLQQILSRAGTPKEVHDRMNEEGFTHVLYDNSYLFGRLSTLSDWEKDLFHRFKEQYLTLLQKDQDRFYLFRMER